MSEAVARGRTHVLEGGGLADSGAGVVTVSVSLGTHCCRFVGAVGLEGDEQTGVTGAMWPLRVEPSTPVAARRLCGVLWL